ncbi:site-2 protease family protein [Haloarcula litorea]|uniref:site-2 protease family protein n=1 Tax=Haloarcula litorea TaxID=3032579 RepID=UPI0023E7C1AD|nr:site-2 protease family protein [Halomicroarcula sp. GDY20]
MAQQSVPADLPDPERLADAFRVYEVETDTEDGVRYYGEPAGDRETVLRAVAPAFRQRGYRVRLQEQMGEHVLVATERSLGVDGVPWTNILLAAATLLSTLFAGSRWYGLPVLRDPASLLGAWPFAAAVLGILAVHEFGHYALSRYHGVQASLPYFIPLPFNAVGTLGAVIRMRDNMPSRRAMFDIGVAGPLAGLVATVGVTAVGVTLEPVRVAGSVGTQIELGYPLLLRGVAALVGEQVTYADPTLMANPVVVGAWVGAFVTFLNLLPVGQLDGAHVARSLLGDWMRVVQVAVPVALFGLAGYLYVFEGGQAAALWAFWGLLTVAFGRVGSPTPLDDSSVGRRRQAVAAVTLLLGLLCFVPVPVALTA